MNQLIVEYLEEAGRCQRCPSCASGATAALGSVRNADDADKRLTEALRAHFGKLFPLYRWTDAETEMDLMAAEIMKLRKEAACPCCKNGINLAGETCSECKGKGLAIVAYDTLRVHLKIAEQAKADALLPTAICECGCPRRCHIGTGRCINGACPARGICYQFKPVGRNLTGDGEDQLAEAERWARELHANQKYGTGSYAKHLEAVIGTLYSFGFTHLPLLSAAWLHDALEDTSATWADIERRISREVADLVLGVTDEFGPDRAARKAATYPKTRKNTLCVALKLADRIANVVACTGSSGSPTKLAMYREEHEAFQEALYRENEYPAMWSHLNALVTR